MAPNPGIGGLVQPQPNATTQGLPPANPQQHQDLSNRWLQFFTNPAVQAGLATFGTSMLANVGSRAPLAARIGLAGGDALRTVGGAAKFQADQQSEVAKQQAEQERLAQGRTGLTQQAEQAKTQAGLQTQALTLDQQRLAQQGTQNQAELALKEKELLSNDKYRNLMLGLQREQMQSTLLGLQTPRGRALQALQKNILDTQQLDPEFDVDKAVTNGMALIDKMFPTASSAVAPEAPTAGAPGATPQGGGAAPSSSATPPGGYTPDNPMPGALPFDQAATYLKANPTPENIADFEVVYGPGSAAKAGVKGP